MTFLKRFVMGIGGIAMLAALLQLATPKAVHAVVSALVTVANTTSNPVPTIGPSDALSQNVELYGNAYPYPDPGESVYLRNPDGTGASTPFVVPDGQTLVITDVDFDSLSASATTENLLELRLSSTGKIRTFWMLIGPTQHRSFRSGIIIPSGNSLTFNNVQGSGTPVYMVLHGYIAPAS
jgi:hypothetical protein